VARVVVLIPELMFGSRVKEALASAGHEVSLVSHEDDARAQAPEADVFVVDLVDESFDGAMLVESMLMGRELGSTRSLGVYAHTDTEARRRAEQAGVDLVVPRSRMARDAAQLVAGLAAGDQVRPPAA
jgi:DNA-binding NarL/FixJ family response regulator